LINLTADHLSHRFQPEKKERQKDYLELISGLKTEVRQLNQMVNDFPAVGRPAKLKKTRFTWSELLDQARRSVQYRLASKEATIEFSGLTDSMVRADENGIKEGRTQEGGGAPDPSSGAPFYCGSCLVSFHGTIENVPMQNLQPAIDLQMVYVPSVLVHSSIPWAFDREFVAPIRFIRYISASKKANPNRRNGT
jgi:hypothetical protein